MSAATADAILRELEHDDIRIAAKEGRLVVNAPKGMLTDELRSRLRARKADLMAVLSRRERATPVPAPVLDAAGLPCEPCQGCGSRGFWQEAGGKGLWRCQTCEPPPTDHWWSACWLPVVPAPGFRVLEGPGVRAKKG